MASVEHPSTTHSTARTTESATRDRDLAILDYSYQAQWAYERLPEDGTPADYLALLIEAHDLFDELAAGLRDWLAEYDLTFDDFMGLVAGVREHEQANDAPLSSPVSRAAVRRLFLLGLTAEQVAIILGLEPEDVAAYLDNKGFGGTRRQVIELFRSGKGASEVAATLGVSRQYVYDSLSKAGIQLTAPSGSNARTYTEGQRKRVIELYRGGKSIPEIERATDLKKATILNICRSAAKSGELPEYPRSRK